MNGISTNSSKIKNMDWKSYFMAVQRDQTHGCDKRCDFLNSVNKGFSEFPVFSNMSKELRKTVAGLPNDQYEKWGWFGAMQGNGYFHKAVNGNNKNLSSALDCIPLSGEVQKSQYVKFIENYKNAFPVENNYLSTASRLLALKRPDQFVCITKRNRSSLCKDLGIREKDLNYDYYWDQIIVPIRSSPWWKSEPPKSESGLELAVWKGRVAMLDAFFYEE